MIPVHRQRFNRAFSQARYATFVAELEKRCGVSIGFRLSETPCFVPASLMAFSLLFASDYFSVITPQGGSQNVIFVGAGYLTQGELYRLGALTTIFCVLVFLVIGTPWLLFVTR